MKLLTITIPCYNSQEYMEHAINSALIGGDDIEIIIVDDGSTDRSGEMCEAFAKIDERIRVVHKKKWRPFRCAECRY